MRFLFTMPMLLVVTVFSFNQALGQHPLDRFVLFPQANVFSALPDPGQIVSNPVDLEFHPDTVFRKNELWVLNQGTNFTGGSTVIYDLANTNPTSRLIQDGNAWNFMALSSAMAFGQNGNWATSQDILDANRANGTYTGPTLWSSDLAIYGKVGNPPSAEINGSHIDGIRQSPYGKGIAWETENVYWVMDGYDSTLKRYDFKAPYSPGGNEYTDGEVIVYSEFSFNRNDSLPAHIVADSEGKWLYGCDTEAKRVFRVDMRSGSFNKTLVPRNFQRLAKYDEYTGLIEETVLDSALELPVGIEVVGNRLLISDIAKEEIILFNLDKMREVGRIDLSQLSSPGVKGIEVGPSGNIYFADDRHNKVYQLTNDSMVVVNTVKTLNRSQLQLYPNPAKNHFAIDSREAFISSIEVFNTTGQQMNVVSQIPTEGLITIDCNDWSKGLYTIVVSISGKGSFTKKLVIE